jgi:UDP-glucuronate 4-epimerase
VKILVTGAAGFIGSMTSVSLIKSGHSVTAIDNFNNYYSSDLKKARVSNLLNPIGIDVANIDIVDVNRISKLIEYEKPDAIFHFAAQAGVRLVNSDINKYVDSNLVGFSNVLLSAVNAQIPNLIYASSSSVYGNSKNFPYSETDLSLRPISFYGATKLANELLAPTLIRNSCTRARGLRFFTVYGPWGRPDMAYFRLINAGMNNSKFQLFGDGSVIRDFTYIDDVVDTIKQLVGNLETQSAGFHDVVNVAGGNPASLNQMISEISKRLGHSIDIDESQMHINDVNKTLADTTYLESLAPKIPRTLIGEGISRTVEWASHAKITPKLMAWVGPSI